VGIGAGLELGIALPVRGGGLGLSRPAGDLLVFDQVDQVLQDPLAVLFGMHRECLLGMDMAIHRIVTDGHFVFDTDIQAARIDHPDALAQTAVLKFGFQILLQVLGSVSAFL